MKLWGGNYESEPDDAFWAFNQSFSFDRRLLAEEIAASQAYARALDRCGAISGEDASRLVDGLARILENSRRDPAFLEIDCEDVHSFVETRLGEIVGDLAGQGHLGRSRNEQAVTALRLWLRATSDHLLEGLCFLLETLVEKGREAAAFVMPGYTHTRAAEPITAGHWLAAWTWGFVRDAERLAEARKRANVLPLGSGALAGTALPLDREALARDLGFDAVSENALDAVMDRDFAADFIFACVQIQTRLSRLAEDLIRLSAPEHGFFGIPESFTTGSSLMPQKKNPDGLELIRGKAGRVQGALVRILVLVKGLGAGYHKDLQEDKEAVFDAAETVVNSVAIMSGIVAGLSLNAEAMRRAADQEETVAAHLAVALAREGLPFRKAHALVGALVAESRKTGVLLLEVAERVIPAHAPHLHGRLAELFDAAMATRAKRVRGGTAPEAVMASLDGALARIDAVRPLAS
ncbi:MAG: argininosuccinate lyase [Vicinamibacteria bacterium]|nr:argininosuccinate lyase [Vicinamibacteria bacterium]